MTEITKRFLPLNTAQTRNLRNLTAAELPYWRLTVVVECSCPLTPHEAKSAVIEVMARHEALRSRLRLDPSGRTVQEVMSPSEAASVIRWLEVTETEFNADDSRFWREVAIDPWSHAFHVTAYVVDEAVTAIKLTAAHVFTDRIGIQIVEKELEALTSGGTLPESEPRQAGAYALSGSHPDVLRNTQYWRSVLSPAPRACTYAPVRREEVEEVACVELRLPDELLERVKRAASGLRTTPNCIWIAASSVLAEGLSGQYRQVFKTTSANRVKPEDFTTVAQLAQVVFIPLEGTPDDTLRRRVDLATESAFAVFERGVYDANAILTHFNSGPGYGGMLFQPAFEWHYIPVSHKVGFKVDAEPRLFQETARIDLPSAQANLQISLSHEPDPVLQIRARRPIHGERAPDALLDDLLHALDLICTSPDASVRSVGITPLPSLGGLTTGHHSGAAISLPFTKALILGVPGVSACDLSVDADGRLHACLTLAAGTDPARVKSEIRSGQTWTHGTVVPDEYTVTFL
jgi:hypothetical protein